MIMVMTGNNDNFLRAPVRAGQWAAAAKQTHLARYWPAHRLRVSRRETPTRQVQRLMMLLLMMMVSPSAKDLSLSFAAARWPSKNLSASSLRARARGRIPRRAPRPLLKSHRCARTLPSSMAPSSSSSFAHRTAPVQSSPRSGPRASSAQLGRNLPRPARSGAPVARSPLLFSFSCLKHKVRFSDCEISAPATPGVVIRCSPSASSEKESSPLPRSEDAN